MDAISNFLESLKQRFNNPFFLSLFFIWLYRYWDIIFLIFNFDADCTMYEKQLIIYKYFENKNFWSELFINLGLALALMIISFGAITLSKIMTNFFYRNIIPSISSLFINDSVLPKEELERLEISNEKLLKTTLQLNSSLRELTSENENLKVKLSNNNEILRNLKTEMGTITADSDYHKNKYEKLKSEQDLLMNELNDTIQKIQLCFEDLNYNKTFERFFNTNVIKSEKIDERKFSINLYIDEDIIQMYNRLENENLIPPFLKFYRKQQINSTSIMSDIDKLIEYGLLNEIQLKLKIYTPTFLAHRVFIYFCIAKLHNVEVTKL